MIETQFPVAGALSLLTGLDAELFGIVGLSLAVSLSAVFLAALVGLPIGALLALVPFKGRDAVIVVLNACMGLPPVVVGLALYLLLSRAGPLGEWGLLFTPGAMVVAQAVLVLPIVAALARQVVADLWDEYGDQLRSFGAGRARMVATLLWDGRLALLTAVLAGFGRAAAEVGAVIIVGGNIRGVTRTMTTAIALETSKGNLSLALGLGLVLICIVLLINASAYALGEWTRRELR